MGNDRTMHPIFADRAPSGAGAVFASCRADQPHCSADAKAILRTLAVAALATACAVVLGVGLAESSSGAPRAAPAGTAPAMAGGSSEGRCRA